MDPEDEALFASHAFIMDKGHVETRHKRAQEVEDRTFEWLERNKYLQNNPYDVIAKRPVGEADRAKSEAMEVEKRREDLTREQQIELIDDTFSAAQDPTTFVHPLHPDWEPVSVTPIFPHECLQGEHTLVVFEHDHPPVKGLVNENDTMTQEEAEALIARAALSAHSSKHHSMYVAENVAQEGPEGESGGGAKKENFRWYREFIKNPTAPVQVDNNFILMDYGNELRYNRFKHRLNLRKRTQTGADADADFEISSRPRVIMLDEGVAVVATQQEAKKQEMDDLFGDSDSDAELDDWKSGNKTNGDEDKVEGEGEAKTEEEDKA